MSTPDGRYACVCKAQWTGVDCAMLVNPCAPSPCLNNAACTAVGTQFTCICPPDRTGRYCEMASKYLLWTYCSFSDIVCRVLVFQARYLKNLMSFVTKLILPLNLLYHHLLILHGTQYHIVRCNSVHLTSTTITIPVFYHQSLVLTIAHRIIQATVHPVSPARYQSHAIIQRIVVHQALRYALLIHVVHHAQFVYHCHGQVSAESER